MRTMLTAMRCAVPGALISATPVLGASDPPAPFGAQAAYPTGERPVHLACADLNGDGVPDLLTANIDDSTLSMLLGNGDGTFQERRDFQLDRRPWSVAIGDFDADGNTDFVSTALGRTDDQFNAIRVSVFLGNGDGTFRPLAEFRSESYGSEIVLGDLDSDGYPDLALAGSFTTCTQLGLGNGAFESAVLLPDVLSLSLKGADLDNNGTLDLINVYGVPDAMVQLGNGDGTFQPSRSVTTSGGNRLIELGDFNGDGRVDLITSSRNLAPNAVQLGNGDGTFGVPIIQTTPFFTDHFTIGDFNADGFDDFATSQDFEPDISVHLSNGDGTFREPQIIAVPNFSNSMIAEDLDADGDVDLAIANEFIDSVMVLLGNGDGTFALGPDAGGAGGAGGTRLAGADDPKHDERHDAPLADARDDRSRPGHGVVPATASSAMNRRATP